MQDSYYEDDFVTIYHGDCQELLPDLVFDVVVTDPPYGINYKQTIKGARNYEKILGDETSDLARWLIAEVHPTPMLVFGINHFSDCLPVAGRWICWDKRVVESADKMLGSPFELAWINTKEDKADYMIRLQHGGVVNADKANETRQHPTQKPVKLMRRCIQYMPEGVILDPFMGSGSTLRAAKDLGRKAIGIEIEEKYCEIAAKRMGQEVLPL
jgi:DNA modification methylase